MQNYDEERCVWCRDGKFDGQTVMLTNHGWADIKYCPNCGNMLSWYRDRRKD